MRPVDDNWWQLFDLLVAEGDLLGRRVLDIGCGTGVLTRALAERGANVWGVDPSPEMVARARETVGRRAGVRQGRAEALPFIDGWFERAVFRLVVHLLDRPRAFREVARVLAPGGRVVVATFDPASLPGFWPTRVFPAVKEIDEGRFPAADTLARELAHAGFSTTRTTSLVQETRLGREEALERIRARFISTLRLLNDEEFERGLARAERELPDEVEDRRAWIVLVAERAHFQAADAGAGVHGRPSDPLR